MTATNEITILQSRDDDAYEWNEFYEYDAYE